MAIKVLTSFSTTLPSNTQTLAWSLDGSFKARVRVGVGGGEVAWEGVESGETASRLWDMCASVGRRNARSREPASI